jgi:hypothetical protein
MPSLASIYRVNLPLSVKVRDPFDPSFGFVRSRTSRSSTIARMCGRLAAGREKTTGREKGSPPSGPPGVTDPLLSVYPRRAGRFPMSVMTPSKRSVGKKKAIRQTTPTIRSTPEAEAPDRGILTGRNEAPEARRYAEAPDAGVSRAALEHEFTHGRSQS